MVPNATVIATDPSAVPCDRFFAESTRIYTSILFGPGLVSVSPANMMIMSRMLVIFFAFNGKHSGLEPESW